jgi:hypothetical protein
MIDLLPPGGTAAPIPKSRTQAFERLALGEEMPDALRT